MTKTNKKFKITSELYNKQSVKKSLDLNDDGSLELEGVASTSNKDLQGDVISRECIEKMKTQALNRNIHADHIYDLDDVIGAITEVYDTDSTTLKIKFKIIPSVAPKIKELLDTGVHLGLSIGGNIIDYTETYTDNGDYGWIVNDINLLEISLTPLPANWDSYGTVMSAKGLVEAKCLTGACSLIRKNLKGESESEFDEIDTSKETDLTDEILSDDRFADLNKSELKELLLKEIEKNETTNELTEEDIEDTNKNMEEEIRKEITEEDVMSMINEVASTMKEQVIAEVKDTLKTEITDSAITEIRDQITDELLGQIKDDVTTEIQSSIMDEVMTEVDNKISEAIAEEQAAEEADDKDPEDNPEDAEPPLDDESQMQEAADPEDDKDPEDGCKATDPEDEKDPEDGCKATDPEDDKDPEDGCKSVEDVNDQKAISMHRLQRNIEKNIEAKILSQLGVERAPVSETEKIVKKWLATKEEPRINKRKVMSRKDLAVRMTDTSNSESPFYRALKEIQEE